MSKRKSVNRDNLALLHFLSIVWGWVSRGAEKAFAAFSNNLSRNGHGATKMLSALDFYLDNPLEVVIVTPGPVSEAEALVNEVRRAYLPNRILTITQTGAELTERAALVPLLDGNSLSAGNRRRSYAKRGAATCLRPSRRFSGNSSRR